MGWGRRNLLFPGETAGARPGGGGRSAGERGAWNPSVLRELSFGNDFGDLAKKGRGDVDMDLKTYQTLDIGGRCNSDRGKAHPEKHAFGWFFGLVLVRRRKTLSASASACLDKSYK